MPPHCLELQIPVLKAPKEAALPRLCATEKSVCPKNPNWPKNIKRNWISSCSLAKFKGFPGNRWTKSQETWYFPHHIVEHNNKHRIVFDSSFEYMRQNLNKSLLSGPTLGPYLFGMLLRFHQNAIAICREIKRYDPSGMPSG